MRFQGTIQQSFVSVDGMNLLSSANLIVLRCYTGAGNYSTLRNNGNGYIVPIGYKLVLKALRAKNKSIAFGQFSLGYGDTAVTNSALAPTNAVTFIPDFYDSYTGGVQQGQRNDWESIIEDLEIPAGKYVFGKGTTYAWELLILGLLVKI